MVHRPIVPNLITAHLGESKRTRQRGGVAAVEFAVTSGVATFFIFALIVGSLGIFRYQEVAHLAREGARYATTHGGTYQSDGIPSQTGVSAVSSSSDLRNYLLPKAVILNPNLLTIQASWSAPKTVTPSNTPKYMDTDPTLIPPGQKSIQNFVTVTVTYQWVPELFLVGPINLTSTSTMPMSY